MSLKKLFDRELKSKTQELFSDSKKKINRAAPKARAKAVKIYWNELNNNRQKLFSHQTEPDESNFHVEKFVQSCFDKYIGLYNDFDLEFSKAKEKDLENFKKHEYLPTAKLFHKQSDEVIITKIAHYYAYIAACKKLNEWGKIISLKYCPPETNLGNTETEKKMSNVDRAFINLFVDPDYCKTADRKIRSNCLDKDGKWKGQGRKLQEIGGLVDALKKNDHITFSNKTVTVQIVCDKYSIDDIADRTARETKGNAYKNFYSHCLALFPKVSSK